MPATTENRHVAETVRRFAQALSGAVSDYDALLATIGDDVRFVLLGEASHGTHEFYAERARITRRLIEERGFLAVALEADWPDAYRINRYVRGSGGEDADADADAALDGFRRFPTWMWRNTVVVEFIEWLRDWNRVHPTTTAGVYGMDLYSLHGSIGAVLDYLDKVDPKAARRARGRYSCFEHFGKDPQAYGYATSLGAGDTCEGEVISQLVELRRRAGELLRRAGPQGSDEFFYAEQNARLVKNAEEYYRSMYRGRASSWNLRDRHMVETLDALVRHLGQGASDGPKLVVWAHNSHLGDARATEMSWERGEWNVGQLVRERYGAAAVRLVGFSTHAGTVTAASDWGETAERKRVRPALADSYEGLFHEVGASRFFLDLRERNAATEILRVEPRLERAIGVIYRPQTERWSHYFQARLPEQFDAILHFDETRALEPLERESRWDAGELPEAFPSGL